MATRSSKVAGNLLLALALRLKANQTSPLTTLHIRGDHNKIGDIPSRSFGGTPKWHYKTDTAFLTFFNTQFPLPNKHSWQLFQINSKISTRVISILLMKHIEMAEWRLLPKLGRSIGGTGVTMSHLWELTLAWRTNLITKGSDHCQDTGQESEQDSTAEDAKLQLARSLRLSQPLARRSRWTQESTPQKQPGKTSSCTPSE